MPVRTGDEPLHARSALRLRCGLAAWGVVLMTAATVAFARIGHPWWALACGVLALVTAVDLAVVVRHIRQGAHYQPGRDVPPYAPADEGGAARRRARGRSARRQR